MTQPLVIEKVFNFIHSNNSSNDFFWILIKNNLKNDKCTLLQVNNKIDFLREHAILIFNKAVDNLVNINSQHERCVFS